VPHQQKIIAFVKKLCYNVVMDRVRQANQSKNFFPVVAVQLPFRGCFTRPDVITGNLWAKENER